MAPGFVPMAHALSQPSNALLQVNSPWLTDRVSPERLLNSKSPCARQSLNTPRDFLHAKLDPTSHHVTSYLAMSRLRLEFVTRLRSATQISRCPWRERHPQLSTPLLSWHPATSTEHNSRNTPVPDISVCCFFFDRSMRATSNTVKNTTMPTLHIKLILLPSSEAHARVLAKLMTACHSHRLQRFCERHGASVPHFVASKIQVSEGSVCLGILEKWKHQSQRASDCMLSRRSRAETRQLHSHEREKTCSARSCRVVSCEVLSYWALSRHVNACDGNCEEGAQQ